MAQRAGRDGSRVERSRGIEGLGYGDCSQALPAVICRKGGAAAGARADGATIGAMQVRRSGFLRVAEGHDGVARSAERQWPLSSGKTG